MTLLTCFFERHVCINYNTEYLCVTDVITSPFIKMSGFTELFILTVKYMQTVLFTLRVKHESADQSGTLLIAAVSLAAACTLVFAWVKITVSSAYICILTSGHTQGRSFIYILNKKS